jgi:hypothetical protein
MQNTTGLSGAAPIWAEFMISAVQQLTGGNPTPFSRPAGIVDRVICSVSGTEPSQWCPSHKNEIYAADQLPLPKEQDLWARVLVDTWTGLRASAACPDFTNEEFVLNVTDTWAVGWLRNDAAGKAWAADHGFQEPILFAPARECRADDPRPYLSFSNPAEGQAINFSPLEIFARVDASGDFRNYELDYGLGSDPVEWNRLLETNQPSPQPGKIYTWDLANIPPGVVTLRLRMHSIRDTMAVLRLRVNIQVATATPTLTPTSSNTPTATDTIVPTGTPVPSQTPAPTSTIQPPDLPTDTPTYQTSETPGPTPTGNNNNPANQVPPSGAWMGGSILIFLIQWIFSYSRRNCGVE